MKRALGLLAVVLAIGCGDSSLPSGDGGAGGGDASASVDGGGGGGASDMKSTGDLAYTLRTDGGPFVCGATPCTSGQKCCASADVDAGLTFMCEAACGAAMTQVQCTAPEQCGGNPCCVNLDSSLQGGILCTTSLTDCAPKVNVMNPISKSTVTTRACVIDADCTAGGVPTDLTKCCKLTVTSQAGQSQKICLNAFYAGLINSNAMGLGNINCN